MDKYIKRDDLISFLDWDHDEQSWYLDPEEFEYLSEHAVDAVRVMHRGEKTVFLRVDNLSDFQEHRIIVDDNKAKGCLVFYLEGEKDSEPHD